MEKTGRDPLAKINAGSGRPFRQSAKTKLEALVGQLTQAWTHAFKESRLYQVVEKYGSHRQRSDDTHKKQPQTVDLALTQA